MRTALFAVLLGAAIVTSSAAQPIPITSIYTSASGTVDGGSQSDEDGPAPSGAVFSEVTFPAYGMTSRAALNDAGVSALEIDAPYFSFKGPSGAGDPGPNLLDGETSWSQTVVNASATTKSYRYTFTVHPIFLRIVDFPFTDHTEDGAPRVAYTVEIARDNVVLFSSHAMVEGGLGSHVLTESGTDFGGVFSSDEASLAYEFSTFSGAISLGALQPLGSMTVTARLIGHTDTGIINTGCFVGMGDPLDLKHDPGVSSVIIEEKALAVEPAAWGAVKGLYGR